jgi:hypothetical protein
MTTPEAALAAALDDVMPTFGLVFHRPVPPEPLTDVHEFAAAITAAMPPDWCGHEAPPHDCATSIYLNQSLSAAVVERDATIARLKRSLRQLRDDLPTRSGYADSIGRFVRDPAGTLVELDPVIDALSAALAEDQP